MNVKHLDLSDFPPLPIATDPESRVDIISVYLGRLLNLQGVTQRFPLQIPSLSQLAKFFHCSQMDVYDAFQRLRRRGYDYELSGMDQPVLFWCSVPLDKVMY